jgi:hypothetical protein
MVVDEVVRVDPPHPPKKTPAQATSAMHDFMAPNHSPGFLIGLPTWEGSQIVSREVPRENNRRYEGKPLPRRRRRRQADDRVSLSKQAASQLIDTLAIRPTLPLELARRKRGAACRRHTTWLLCGEAAISTAPAPAGPFTRKREQAVRSLPRKKERRLVRVIRVLAAGTWAERTPRASGGPGRPATRGHGFPVAVPGAQATNTSKS